MAKKDDKTTESKTDKKPKTSLRQRNEQAAAAKTKPKRIRKAATSAKKPIGRIRTVLTTDYHLLPNSGNDGFFTKNRSFIPKYFRDSFNELKNVTWPGRKETWKLVFAVFVFALLLGVFIAALDFVLERIFKEVIL